MAKFVSSRHKNTQQKRLVLQSDSFDIVSERKALKSSMCKDSPACCNTHHTLQHNALHVS